MTRTTRRGLLGGAAVLVAAPVASVAVPAQAHPDADLLQLGAELAEAIVLEDAAWANVDAFAASDDDDDPHRALASERMDDVGDLVKLIGEVPATTLDGLLVKLRAILWCQSGDVFEAENLEIGMGEGPPSTHSVVLAGLLNDMAVMERGA